MPGLHRWEGGRVVRRSLHGLSTQRVLPLVGMGRSVEQWPEEAQQAYGRRDDQAWCWVNVHRPVALVLTRSGSTVVSCAAPPHGLCPSTAAIPQVTRTGLPAVWIASCCPA